MGLPVRAETDPLRPNIVIILADDLGWSDIGCYGSEIPTPNLDRLAAGGMRFTQFHNTAKCFPSRACLMTGLYAQQCGMDKTAASRQTNAVTFGRVLKDAGYRTLMVGKHHGLDNPFEMGFDHYVGLRDGAANYFNPGHPREGEPVPAQKRPGGRTWCFDGRVVKPYTPEDPDFYSTDTFTDWALNLLKTDFGKNRPFLLYLAYQAPHDPLQAWPEDIARHEGIYEAGYEVIAEARYRKQLELKLIDEGTFPRSAPDHRPWESLSAAERADQIRRMTVYAAMIDRLDQNIGRLLQHLENNGDLENTLILFASDNGASAETVEIGEGPIGSIDRWSSLGGDWANVANTPFRKFKNYSHEGGTCTPLIAFWPGVIAGGSVTDQVGHFIDIMPTLVEVAGATYPVESDGQMVGPMEGRSLLPVFQGQHFQRGEPLFFQWQRGRAIIDQGWKAVQWDSFDWELYRISEDRTETRDLAVDRPDILAPLMVRHGQWARDVGAEIGGR
jgi:arylsulfatase